MAGNSPLIALPPSPASPADSTSGADDWWPAIDRNAARAALRLGEVVTDTRLAAALQGAAITITSDLVEWQGALTTLGADKLADVTADQLLALKVPTEPRYPSRTFNSWWESPAQPWVNDPSHTPFTHPRYSPARAAWLAAPLDGANRLVLIYTRAVRAMAAAELVEFARDMGASHQADVRAEVRLDPAAEYRRLALEGVRDLLGLTRSQIELV